MNSLIFKGRDGWEAETRVQIDAERALRITTRKGSRGVQTSATVVKPTPTGFVWSPFDDYKEMLREAACAAPKKLFVMNTPWHWPAT